MFLDLSLNCSNHVTSTSIVVLSDLRQHVKRLNRWQPVKSACSDNGSRQNVFNVSSFSKLVKPLTASKPVFSIIVSKLVCLTSVHLTRPTTKIQ